MHASSVFPHQQPSSPPPPPIQKHIHQTPRLKAIQEHEKNYRIKHAHVNIQENKTTSIKHPVSTIPLPHPTAPDLAISVLGAARSGRKEAGRPWIRRRQPATASPPAACHFFISGRGRASLLCRRYLLPSRRATAASYPLVGSPLPPTLTPGCHRLPSRWIWWRGGSFHRAADAFAGSGSQEPPPPQLAASQKRGGGDED